MLPSKSRVTSTGLPSFKSASPRQIPWLSLCNPETLEYPFASIRAFASRRVRLSFIEVAGALQRSLQALPMWKFERHYGGVGGVDLARVTRAGPIKISKPVMPVAERRVAGAQSAGCKSREHSSGGRIGGRSRRLRLRECRQVNRCC
jgi:hypothetical protein